MKLKVILLLLLALCTPLYAKEYYASNPAEYGEALAQAKGGDTIHISGIWETTLGISKMIYPDDKPLTLDGKNATLNHGLTIMDCHNVTARGFYIPKGNGTAGVDLNDSYPEFGMRNIHLINLRIIEAGPRGIFQGGYNIQGLVIDGCIIKGPAFGTHGIYLTGSHFNGNYPPVRNTIIRNCTIEMQAAARNSIQCNGRFLDGKILNNTIRHAQLYGISLIGCQNFIVRGNVSYGHNRGPAVVIYDYAEHWKAYYNYFHTQADVDAFNSCHQPNQKILIEYNTFVVGLKQFSIDAYHSDDPTDGHPVILINNAVHSGFTIWDPNPPPLGPNDEDPVPRYVKHPLPGINWVFPSAHFIIQHNIFVTPNLNIIDTYNEHEGLNTILNHNLIHCTTPGTPYVGQSGRILAFYDNIIRNPGFEFPIYDFVNLIQNPGYNWDDFRTYFNAYTRYGKREGVGKKFPIPVFGRESKELRKAMEIQMEYADPIKDKE